MVTYLADTNIFVRLYTQDNFEQLKLSKETLDDCKKGKIKIVVLSEVIPQAIKRLKKGGRFVVISFYSGEDRIVKHSFREMAHEEKPIVGLVTKKPVFATEEEIAINPKAASARLRAVERL